MKKQLLKSDDFQESFDYLSKSLIKLDKYQKIYKLFKEDDRSDDPDIILRQRVIFQKGKFL
jgi:hypothetical protein